MSYSTHSAMPTPAVLKLVDSCWREAEFALRSHVEENPDKEEEFITEHFHDELRRAITARNKVQAFEHAFVSDLRAAFSGITRYGLLEGLARGVKAKIWRHNRATERRTGGDLGLVLVRPDMESVNNQLHLKEDYERGLLCQAKLKSRPIGRRRSRWGKFTDRQQELLPRHLDYLALLLYEYADVDRMALKPFSWQLCANHDFDDVQKFLLSGEFPALLDSSRIIRDLGEGRIGTDDRGIIRSVICPDLRSSLRIVVGWDDGDRPQEYTKIHNLARQESPRLLA